MARERWRHRIRDPRWARWLIAIGVILVVLPSSGLASAYVLADRYDRQIQRVDGLLPGGGHQRVTGPMNILVLGVDNDGGSRAYQGVFGTRSDTIMMVHLPKSMKAGYAVSFPRDSYVDIPPQKAGGKMMRWDGGKNKINAAVAYGGPQLLVKTIQKMSGLTIDHVVLVNFSAVRSIVDSVGGVDVTVDKTVTDTRSKRTFKQGVNHLDGNAALDYVRQRYNLTEGDFDRVKRQQALLSALVEKVTSTGIVTNPAKLDGFVSASVRSLQVSSGLPVKDLGFSLRSLRPNDVSFVTLPFAGYLRTEVGVANRVDETKAAALFNAIKTDTMPAYLKKNPANNVKKVR